MVYSKTEMMRLIKWNNFDMTDFYYVCPYDFNDPLMRTRKREVVLWRNVGMIWSWLSGNTSVDAGKEFNMDHSVVFHALKQLRAAYDGYGHVEMIDHIETIKDKSNLIYRKTNDVCTNYAICQVRLENNIAKKLVK